MTLVPFILHSAQTSPTSKTYQIVENIEQDGRLLGKFDEVCQSSVMASIYLLLVVFITFGYYRRETRGVY